jgi:glycosyltransferase involved in cell wall biosynthesis
MITVVVPTFNRPQLLSEALRSIANQTHSDFEVMIVNDGGESVESVVQRWRSRFSLRLIETGERRGPAAARNLAINESRSPYLAFLDDDDIFLPQHLEAAYAELTSSARPELVYTGALVSKTRVSALPREREDAHTKSYPFDERFLLVANFIHTGSVVARNFRDTAVRFDESLSLCEDWDLWLALVTDLRYKPRLVDRITTVYHQVPGQRGLVADAQAVTPTPFASARQRIYSKWPSDDQSVQACRYWLTEFESYRNDVIARGKDVPIDLFDRVLRHLASHFHDLTSLDYSIFAALFDVAD